MIDLKILAQEVTACAVLGSDLRPHRRYPTNLKEKIIKAANTYGVSTTCQAISVNYSTINQWLIGRPKVNDQKKYLPNKRSVVIKEISGPKVLPLPIQTNDRSAGNLCVKITSTNGTVLEIGNTSNQQLASIINTFIGNKL